MAFVEPGENEKLKINSLACVLHDWNELHQVDEPSEGDIDFVEDDGAEVIPNNEDFSPPVEDEESEEISADSEG